MAQKYVCTTAPYGNNRTTLKRVQDNARDYSGIGGQIGGIFGPEHAQEGAFIGTVIDTIAGWFGANKQVRAGELLRAYLYDVGARAWAGAVTKRGNDAPILRIAMSETGAKNFVVACVDSIVSGLRPGTVEHRDISQMREVYVRETAAINYVSDYPLMSYDDSPAAEYIPPDLADDAGGEFWSPPDPFGQPEKSGGGLLGWGVVVVALYSAFKKGA